MSDDGLCYSELMEVSERIRKKELSPVKLTEAMLDRIVSVDKMLHSYALVLADSALREAKVAEEEIAKGNNKGPLHGVPIAVKDNCFTKGIVTTNGMAIRRDVKPDHDATVVAKLRDAGAILLGKLHHTEGAFAEHHPTLPVPVNPWNAAVWAGASSSGSGVAAAAGLCFACLGTDTGGSIRFPCDTNGVTGLKPTYGRVSRYGVFENSATIDHVGPMARSVADLAAMLGAMAGRDEDDPTTEFHEVPNYLAVMKQGAGGLRIGVDRAYNTAGVEPVIISRLNAAMEIMREQGAEVVNVSMPNPDQTIKDWLPYSAVEMGVAHEATYPSRKTEYGPALSGFIELGLQQTAADYHKILKRRNEFRGRLAALFRDIDLLAIPTESVAAPTVAKMATLGEDPDELLRLIRFTCPFDMSGHPTIILPVGFTDDGNPMTFQFVGRPFEEETLFRAGYSYQSKTQWHRRHPSI
jgi:amidase